MDEKLNELLEFMTNVQEGLVKLKKEVLTLQDAVIQLQLAEKERLIKRLDCLEISKRNRLIERMGLDENEDRG